MRLLRTIILSLLLCLCSASLTWAQKQIAVSGRVISESDSEPLPGVGVTIKGTTSGAVTDVDGTFLISAPEGATLQLIYIGMQTLEITVTPRMSGSVQTFRLKEDALALDDAIVVGYGVQKKQSVVGAISQVKSEEIARTGGVTNISNALTGLVPGLSTLNVSGKPGEDDADIIIRAKSTWNGSSPLVLVDGIERGMNDIDVSEVESISVLKDASATAVFGVRGGNGVILVTTKRGQVGKPVMTASANITAKTKSKMPSHLGSYEALLYRNAAIENQVATSPSSWSYYTPVSDLRKYRDQTDPYMYPDVDWTEEMIRKFAWSQRYNWDIRGGTDFVKYYSSLTYLYDGDILKGQDVGQGYTPTNDYSRYNYRINLDFTPTRTTTISVDLDGATGVERTTNAGATYLWRAVYYKGPDQYPVRYPDGTWANNENGYNMYNPVELLNYSGMSKETRMDANASLSVLQKLDFITKGLSVKASVNFRNFYYSTGPNISASLPMTKYIEPTSGITTWNTPSSWSSAPGFEFDMAENTISSENSRTNVYKYLTYQASVNWQREFGQKHDISAMGLFKRIENSTGAAFATYREEWAARLTYAYDARYLLEINGAYNGSEKFAKGNKFGFFPSAAAGWVISQERFIRESSAREWLDLLKIRYSWGRVGSDNNIPKWLYITQWAKTTNSAMLGYPDTARPPYSGFKVSNIGNEDARWETSVKNDIALESAFFGHKLAFNVDYFWGRRYDIFMNASQRNIPPWFGANPVAANIGRTHESGVELEVKWNHKLSNGLRYYINTMASYAQDMVDYMEDPELTPSYQKKAGYPIGQQHVILSDGIIKSWDEMYTSVTGENYSQAVIGMYRLVDYNGDGVVNTNDNVPYGYANHPQYNFSITVGASWKKWSAMIQFHGTRNCTLIQAESEFSSPYYYSVIDTDVAADMWIPGMNPNGTHHIPTYMLSGNATSNGFYYLKDGTQWRIKNAELAYRVDNGFLKKIGINKMNIFLNGNNLFLYSHLNEDRETGGKRDNDHVSAYPITRRINLGVKIEF